MAKGRTVGAGVITDLDNKVLQLCKSISDFIAANISDVEKRKEFMNSYGKISFNRDAGSGLGGGKLQRDALTTRGVTNKAPFSNRNFRWNPLVVSNNNIDYAKNIECIKVKNKELIFVVKVNGKLKEYKKEEVYSLPERFTIIREQWDEHVRELSSWSDTDWTANSCIIASNESCDWSDAVEVYAVLAISIGTAIYGVDFNLLYKNIVDMLSKQTIDKQLKLPSAKFPVGNIDDFICCPMTRIRINEKLDKFRKTGRCELWKPNWRQDKRSEGNDDSLQIMHVNPLIESEQRHNASNVRYGFRWSNVAMTDHSKEETLDFMEYILKANGRIK